MERAIKSAMYECIPRIKISQTQHPKWFTPSISHQIKCLRTLRRITKKHPTHYNIIKLQEREEALQKEIRSAKLNFESALLDDHATTVNHNKICKKSD